MANKDDDKQRRAEDKREKERLANIERARKKSDAMEAKQKKELGPNWREERRKR